jgi:hypothetical protein
VNSRLSRTRILTAACLLLAATLAGGCFNPFDPLIASNRGVSVPPPPPTTPRGALELFQWCYQHRAIDEYRELFTDDYIFQFSEQDSAGNAFRDRPWTREDEMASTTNLFVGGSASEPPADRISLDFTNTPTAYPDHRKGKTAGWHQEILAEFNLRVDRGGSSIEVRGPGLFYFVRGDSAAIPEELVQRGFGPDPNRWYIERWEDQTNSGTFGTYSARRTGGSAAARPAGSAQGVETTSDSPPLPPSVDAWGAIKVFFLYGRR